MARGPVAPQPKSQCACGGELSALPRDATASSARRPPDGRAMKLEPPARRADLRPRRSRARTQTHDPGTGEEQVLTTEAEPPVLAPTPTATTYPGCTTAQNPLVDTARTTARTKATDAATAMTALKGGTGTTAQQTALTANFGTLTSAQYDTAKTTYTTIATRLGNAALFACGSAPAQAYCGPPDNWCAGTVCPTTTGISYLCPNAFTANCAEPESVEHHAARIGARCRLLSARCPARCHGLSTSGAGVPHECLQLLRICAGDLVMKTRAADSGTRTGTGADTRLLTASLADERKCTPLPVGEGWGEGQSHFRALQSH